MKTFFALLSDISRQNYTVFPRRYYVDTLKQCRSCRRPFIFFAREQQYWFEELGFFVDADCVRCTECRKSEQQVRQTLQRYSQAVGRADLDDVALATLVEDAAFLAEASVLRDEQRIRRFEIWRASASPTARRPRGLTRSSQNWKVETVMRRESFPEAGE